MCKKLIKHFLSTPNRFFFLLPVTILLISFYLSRFASLHLQIATVLPSRFEIWLYIFFLVHPSPFFLLFSLFLFLYINTYTPSHSHSHFLPFPSLPFTIISVIQIIIPRNQIPPHPAHPAQSDP